MPMHRTEDLQKVNMKGFCKIPTASCYCVATNLLQCDRDDSWALKFYVFPHKTCEYFGDWMSICRGFRQAVANTWDDWDDSFQLANVFLGMGWNHKKKTVGGRRRRRGVRGSASLNSRKPIKKVVRWVCLKIGYIPNYSHLIRIMIINHWV